MDLAIWKFVVPAGQYRPIRSVPGLFVAGCVSAVVAQSEEDARTTLAAYAAAESLDARWLEAATVSRLPLHDGLVITWVML